MSFFPSNNLRTGKYIDTIADLKSLRAYRPRHINDGDSVLVTSALTTGDANGGAYVWVEDSAAIDNNDTVIVPDYTIGNGRWIKMFGKGSPGEGVASLANANGSGRIGYSLASNGSVSRTLADKLADFSVSPEDFGAVGNSVANDYIAIQSAIDAVASMGGGIVRLKAGKTYRSNSQIVLKSNVKFDLNSGKLLMALSEANHSGIKVRSNTVLENGTIEVLSSGSPSYQTGVHSPVLIGNIYGDGGTPATPNTDDYSSGWIVRNLFLSTNKNIDKIGGVAIAIVGGVNNGIIENITVPDNPFMNGGIHADWGFLGVIVSNDIAGNRSRFDSNPRAAMTTHPNNIIVRNIKIGKLTRPNTGQDFGSHGIRLSGVYNFIVENVVAEEVTYVFLRHTAGDVGFEFADETVKPFACHNIVFRNCSVKKMNSGNGIYSDSLADNVYRAVRDNGYASIINPLHQTNIVFDNIVAKGASTTTMADGIFFIQQRGGTAIRCEASGYRNGAVFESMTIDCRFDNCRTYANRNHGVYAEHGSFPPLRCSINNAISFQNATDSANVSTGANIFIGQTLECLINGGVIGSETETGCRFGIFTRAFVDGTKYLSIIGDPYVAGHASGGIAILVGSESSYGTLRIFTSARFGTGVTNKFGGLAIVPFSIDSSGEATRTMYRSSRLKLSSDTTPPAGFPGVAGDIIFFTDPNANSRSVCTTTGSPGTWSARP